MVISRNIVESILKTLPISLYAGRQVPTELVDEGMSYFNPLEDRIAISYPAIEGLFAALKDDNDFDVETEVRSTLYHEISHVLLTPQNFYDGYKDKALGPEVLNVFEDERIETLLRDYYYGVNFKKSIKLLNNYPDDFVVGNPFQEFYGIVRFRDGDEDFIKETDDIISCYSGINNSHYVARDYQQSVYNLFLKVAKKWYENNDHDKLTSIDPNYDTQDSTSQMNTVERALQQDKKETQMFAGLAGVLIKECEDGSDMKDGAIKGAKIHGSIIDTKDGSCSEDDDDEGGVKLDHYESHVNPLGKTVVQNMLDTLMNNYIDPDLTQQIADVFDSFTKRTSNNAASARRYSGVLNPRMVGTPDWRIFEYKSDDGDINGYDKLHLNLFIDTSGSFCGNQNRVNTILKSLTDLEKKYNFFSYDLVTCQVGEKLRSKKERYIKTGGGNDLDADIHPIYKSLQDQTSFNYNIILFDGDAFTDARGRNHQCNFGAFNNNNCCIISDKDNKQYIEKYAPSAFTILVNNERNKSYSELLYENILTAIKRILLG